MSSQGYSLLGLVSDGSVEFLNLISEFQLNIPVITPRICKSKMFFMLILSYCCCVILSGYFYTSKQNGDIGHSPGSKNNWHKLAVFTSLPFLSPPGGVGHVRIACRERSFACAERHRTGKDCLGDC